MFLSARGKNKNAKKKKRMHENIVRKVCDAHFLSITLTAEASDDRLYKLEGILGKHIMESR